MVERRGGLSVLDYVKIISVQQASRSGLQALAPTITTLADTEGLRAHGDSVRLRCSKRRTPRKRTAQAATEATAAEKRGEDA